MHISDWSSDVCSSDLIAQVQDLALVSLFPADDFGHPAHLHDTECGPKFIEPVVHSLNFISRTAPVIAEGSHVPLEIGIGCDRDAAFSGRDRKSTRLNSSH